MSEVMWVRSHVRQLLQEEWRVARVEVDCDGDVPFRFGSAMCWVSVLDSDPIMVRVFAHAAHGMRPSLKLLRELNDIEGRSLSARVTLDGGYLVVSQTLAATGLTGPVLTQAVDAVSSLACDIGPLLTPMFGGTTPFPICSGVDVDEESA